MCAPRSGGWNPETEGRKTQQYGQRQPPSGRSLAVSTKTKGRAKCPNVPNVAIPRVLSAARCLLTKAGVV